MSKTRKSIIICLIAIALLVGLYFAVSMLSDNKTGDSTGNAKPLEAKSLCEYNYKDVKSVVVQVGDETNTLVRDGSGNVIFEGHNLPLNADNMSIRYAAALNMQYYKTVTDTLDTSKEYGFGSPLAKYTVMLSDGGQDSYTIGMQTPTKDGYYLIKEGDSHIYMTTSSASYVVNCMLKDGVDLALSPKIDGVDKVSICTPKTENNTIVIEKNNETNLDSTNLSYRDYIITQPDTGIVLDDYYVNDVLLKFTSAITATSVEAVYPKDISLYKADRELYFEKDGVKYHFYVSAPLQDNSCYVLNADKTIVYKTDYDSYFSGLDLSLLQLQSKVLFLEHISAFKQITINDTFDTTFTLSGESTDKSPLVVKQGTYETNASSFKKLYSKLLEIYIEGTVEKNDKIGEKLLEVNFSYKNSDKIMHVAYYKIDAMRVALKVDDKDIQYYVYNKNIDAVYQALKVLAEK